MRTHNLALALAETALGGLDVFLPYVKHYVQRFMGQSITTQQWKEDLVAYFRADARASKVLEGILWEVRERLTCTFPWEPAG